MLYLSNLDIKKIENFLEEKIILKSLKNWRAFVRKKILKQYPITPFPFLVISKSTKSKYKLLLSEKNYEYQIDEIFKNNSQILNLDLSPKVLFKTDNFLLIEYIDGNFPNFEDKKFASKIGKYLAKLHSLNISLEKKDKILNNILDKKDIFYNHNINIEKIIKILNKNLPSNLYKSFTYADHNLGNYIINNDSLKLIDLGSFLKSEIQDLHLLVSNMFHIIDKQTFWNSYFEINKNKFISNHLNELCLLSYSLNFINMDFRIKKSPFYDLRVKYHKRQNLNNLINKINEIIK